MIVLTLVEKVVLNAKISERPPSFKLFTAANERNAEAEKRQNKIGIIISPSENKKCIEIHKLKQLKNWNLPIVMLAILFSVQTVPTYCYVYTAPTGMLAFTGKHRLFDRFAENVIVRNALGN